MKGQIEFIRVIGMVATLAIGLYLLVDVGSFLWSIIFGDLVGHSPEMSIMIIKLIEVIIAYFLLSKFKYYWYGDD